MATESGSSTDDAQSPDREDPVLTALDQLESGVEATVQDGKHLERVITEFRHRRRGGATARELLSGPRPANLLGLVDTIAARAVAAAGSIRRALVHALAGEGESVTAIARILGVSHQRISSLLRRNRTS
jgi:hypothetical protein